jgi:hypothetical protein
MLLRLAMRILLIAGFSVSAFGQDHGRHVSPYAGQESRPIKSLSAERVADLLAGRGAGYAKAAELNGVPGPAHVLEMKDAISLTVDQERRVRVVHARMEKETKVLGAQLVASETKLNEEFASAVVTADNLRSLLDRIARIESDLRFAHLAAHLKIPEIVTADYIQTYNRLRGYVTDPCVSVPKGHDAEPWKRHNNCPE